MASQPDRKNYAILSMKKNLIVRSSLTTPGIKAVKTFNFGSKANAIAVQTIRNHWDRYSLTNEQQNFI